jgi:hypothetical protein
VANKRQYIERLKLAVEHLHKCSAVHVETVPIHETFQGQTVWQGEVEVFDIAGHPKATRAYGWSHKAGEDDTDERFVAVLHLPPVDSALTALRVSLVKEIRSNKRQ